jgi:hypothetical protein
MARRAAGSRNRCGRIAAPNTAARSFACRPGDNALIRVTTVAFALALALAGPARAAALQGADFSTSGVTVQGAPSSLDPAEAAARAAVAVPLEGQEGAHHRAPWCASNALRWPYIFS